MDVGSSQMERVSRIIQNHRFQRIYLLFVFIFIISCSISPKPEQVEELKENKEFDEIVKVVKIPPKKNKKKKEESAVNEPKTKNVGAKKSKKKNVETADKSKKESGQEKKAVKKLAKHLPELEDSEGFDGRRPIFDPFIVGEKATMEVAFTGIPAGTVDFTVNPYLEVNGEKSYHFLARARSNAFFSFFYKVDDWVETYVRYKDWLPLTFSMHVRESKQFRESRTYFDWKNLKGKFWEKKIRSGKTREKKIEWDILPFSQNVVSGFYYIRLLKYKAGKRFKFRVADDGKNLIVQVDCLRKEKVSTGLGEFDAYLSKVQFEYNGVFKQTGDILLWTIDDEYQTIAKIEAKIKLGTISMTLQNILRPESQARRQHRNQRRNKSLVLKEKSVRSSRLSVQADTKL